MADRVRPKSDQNFVWSDINCAIFWQMQHIIVVSRTDLTTAGQLNTKIYIKCELRTVNRTNAPSISGF